MIYLSANYVHTCIRYICDLHSELDKFCFLFQVLDFSEIRGGSAKERLSPSSRSTSLTSTPDRDTFRSPRIFRKPPGMLPLHRYLLLSLTNSYVYVHTYLVHVMLNSFLLDEFQLVLGFRRSFARAGNPL